MWPDHLPRFARVRAALEIARADPHPPVLHTGDMVDDVGAVAETVAPGQPLVVFHSWVAAYLTEARQRELVDAVRRLSTSRPVHYLYAESPVDTRGLPTPPSPKPGPTSDVATVAGPRATGRCRDQVGRHAPPREVAALVALAGESPGSYAVAPR